jgi:FYVE, RhoGEF and PH domain containing 5/6
MPLPSPTPSPPALSPLLLSHFPYLSLYAPFITAFPNSLSTLSTLLSQPSSFTAFIHAQQHYPRCGKLTLRDWLLTIVQRCPRYLLLLKDLIVCTPADDPEYARLEEVHALVSKSKDPLIFSASRDRI